MHGTGAEARFRACGWMLRAGERVRIIQAEGNRARSGHLPAIARSDARCELELQVLAQLSTENPKGEVDQANATLAI